MFSNLAHKCIIVCHRVFEPTMLRSLYLMNSSLAEGLSEQLNAEQCRHTPNLSGVEKQLEHWPCGGAKCFAQNLAHDQNDK